MQKIFRFFLSSDQKRRRLAVSLIIWLLRQIRDVEENEISRNSDILDSLDLCHESVPCRNYIEIEEDLSSSECALGILEAAIDDLEFAY